MALGLRPFKYWVLILTHPSSNLSALCRTDLRSKSFQLPGQTLALLQQLPHAKLQPSMVVLNTVPGLGTWTVGDRGLMSQMGNHLFVGVDRGIIILGLLRWWRISSTHSIDHEVGRSSKKQVLQGSNFAFPQDGA